MGGRGPKLLIEGYQAKPGPVPGPGKPPRTFSSVNRPISLVLVIGPAPAPAPTPAAGPQRLTLREASERLEDGWMVPALFVALLFAVTGFVAGLGGW
jgi:hypothetical protein